MSSSSIEYSIPERCPFCNLKASGPTELREHIAAEHLPILAEDARRPNPETQAVAEYHAPMVLIESPDYAEYLRTHPSQVPSQETQAAKLRELEKEFRETAETIAGTASAAGVLACADRLSQEHKNLKLVPLAPPVESVPVKDGYRMAQVPKDMTDADIEGWRRNRALGELLKDADPLA